MSTREEALEIIRNSEALGEHQYNIMLLRHANIYIDILNTDPTFYALRYNPFFLINGATYQEELAWNILDLTGLFNLDGIEVEQYMRTVNDRVLALRYDIAETGGGTIVIGELFRIELITEANLGREISNATSYGDLNGSNFGSTMSGLIITPDDLMSSSMHSVGSN